MTGIAFTAPDSLAGVIELLERYGPDAHLIAGGTATMLLLRQRLIEPAVIVALRYVPGLAGVATSASRRGQRPAHLEIGPMTTLRTIEQSAAVRAAIPVLAEACGRVGTVRIRNQATLGGNLAHADPAQDPPPVLIALGAEVRLTGPSGPRTVPIEDLFVDVFETTVGSTEVLTRIDVPVPAAGSRLAFTKFVPRTADDYATVCVAIRIDLAADGTVAAARVALGAVGPVPIRAHAAEAALVGKPFDLRAIEVAADAAAAATDPFDNVRGSAAYKRDMARIWVARTLLRLAGDGASPARPTPGAGR